MRLKSLFREIAYYFKYGPRPKNLRTLPEGVRRMTDAEDEAHRQQWDMLPVIKEFNTHFSMRVGDNALARRVGEKLYYKVVRARSRFVAKHCRDFSCGIAVCFTRSGQGNFYEPYDLQKKTSDYLVAFLKKHGVTT
jgi:hypothetical protein